jgi:hypothetical protein
LWRALELHPHRVTGDLPGAATLTLRPGVRTAPDQSSSSDSADPALQLVRLVDKTERVLSTFRAETSGKFVVSNVPHGRYRVQVSQQDGGAVIRSLPFDVGDGRSETVVRWPPL